MSAPCRRSIRAGRRDGEPWARRIRLHLERPSAGRLLSTLVMGSAVYGSSLGLWRGGRMAVIAGVKLPLLLVATLALTAPFAMLLVRAFGLRLTPRQTVASLLGAMARAALLLAALAPVAALFGATIPSPGAPDAAARTAHNGLYLLHVGLVATSGVAGMLALRGDLQRSAPPTPAGRRAARRVLAGWIAVSCLVSGEVAWALRPFVGSIYEPVAWRRDDALEGNVYEFVITDIVPFLLRRSGESTAERSGFEP